MHDILPAARRLVAATPRKRAFFYYIFYVLFVVGIENIFNKKRGCT
jgi:hypothetical protein